MPSPLRLLAPAAFVAALSGSLPSPHEASAATVVRRGPAGGVTAARVRPPVARRAVVVAPVRPVPAVRPWYWGRVVAGVTIGTIIVASAVAVAPAPPSPELCWYWSDASKTKGYWNYCVAPAQ